MSDMSGAPIGQVFAHVYDGVTAEEIEHAIGILLRKPDKPTSFAVTSDGKGGRVLRLSRNSHEYLLSQLTGVE